MEKWAADVPSRARPEASGSNSERKYCYSQIHKNGHSDFAFARNFGGCSRFFTRDLGIALFATFVRTIGNLELEDARRTRHSCRDLCCVALAWSPVSFYGLLFRASNSTNRVWILAAGWATVAAILLKPEFGTGCSLALVLQIALSPR